jgi:hypothetical protein
MEWSRYDWARQDLEAVKFELYRLNHLKNYKPSMQFFTNELKCICEIQEELLLRAPLSREVQEKAYWLAATLNYSDQPWSVYHGKLTTCAAIAAAVCGVMEGCRSSWMAPSPSWDIFQN